MDNFLAFAGIPENNLFTCCVLEEEGFHDWLSLRPSTSMNIDLLRDIHIRSGRASSLLTGAEMYEAHVCECFRRGGYFVPASE